MSVSRAARQDRHAVQLLHDEPFCSGWDRHEASTLSEEVARLATSSRADSKESVFMHHGVQVPIRWSLRPGSDRLLVMFNGAVDRTRSRSGIVFQRSSWRDELEAHCLWISDPTITPSIQLRIGWGQLNGVDFLPEAVKPLVDAFAAGLGGIHPSRRLFYGSSAGGFQALASAALDPGSTAMVNNPQTHWLLYPVRRDVSLVTHRVLGRSSSERVLADFPWRSDLRSFFERVGTAPKVEYYINFSSSFDVRDHYLPLREWYMANPARANLFTSRSYRDQGTKMSAHAPMDRGKTINAVNRILRNLD